MTNAPNPSQSPADIPETTDSSITGFVQDVAATTDGRDMQSLMSCLWSAPNISKKQQIADFLERPQRLTTFSINESTPYRVYSKDLSANELFLPFRLWADKIRHFTGMRATLRIRVEVNASPFNQGRLLICYNPMFRSNEIHVQRFEPLTAATQLPRTELVVSGQTEAILEIPYISNVTHHNILTGEHAWGRMAILIYQPVRVAETSADPQVTVWVSAHDLELVVPTAVDAVAEAGSPHEAEQKKQGPISNILNITHKVASSLSDIPVLGEIAVPVAWASKIAGGVASFFGWSKPLDTDRVARIRDMGMGYEANHDGFESAYPMGASATNEISIMSKLAGTDHDEMSFNYIKSCSAYFASFEWSAADSPEQFLWSSTVDPANFFTDDISNNTRHYTPIGFLANRCQLWRGGIKFKFKFSRTDYHSGRLVFWFAPMGASNGVPDDTAYVHREIVDVRLCDEYEFCVPFVEFHQYLSTRDAPWSELSVVGVSVINPLIAPDTVSSIVDVAVEVSGCSDLEFAIFRDTILYDPDNTILPTSAPSGVDPIEPIDFVSEAQAEAGGIRTEEHYIGSSKPAKLCVEPAAACIGEMLTSVKQLLMRTWYYSRSTFNLLADFGTPGVNQTLTSNSNTIDSHRLWDVIRHSFLFERGSIIYRALPTEHFDEPSYWTLITPTGSNQNQLVCFYPHVGTDDGVQSFKAPFYNRTFAKLVAEESQVEVRHYPSKPCVYARTVADDYQLSFFLGIPALRIVSED